MRKLIAKRCLAALLALWLIAVHAAAQGLPGARIPAYELLRNGDNVGYLVGTMHTDDPRVMAMLDAIEPLIDRVDTVAIELVPDGVAMLAVAAATLLPADESLSAHVGADRFAALREAAQTRGLPDVALERLKPWAAAVILGVPEMSGTQVLDTAIYLAALQRQRPVIGLESPAEQISVFDEMAPAMQLDLLDVVIKEVENLPMQLEALTLAYLSGDITRIDEVARSQYGAASRGLQQWFEAVLLARRNERMLMRVMPSFDQGRVLIAVGAMHLGGDQGLIAGLRSAGLELVPVAADLPSQ